MSSLSEDQERENCAFSTFAVVVMGVKDRLPIFGLDNLLSLMASLYLAAIVVMHKYYEHCIEKWALCYRHYDRSGVNTNMLVEK